MGGDPGSGGPGWGSWPSSAAVLWVGALFGGPSWDGAGQAGGPAASHLDPPGQPSPRISRPRGTVPPDPDAQPARRLGRRLAGLARGEGDGGGVRQLAGRGGGRGARGRWAGPDTLTRGPQWPTRDLHRLTPWSAGALLVSGPRQLALRSQLAGMHWWAISQRALPVRVQTWAGRLAGPSPGTIWGEGGAR